MQDIWNEIQITRIVEAKYVAPNTGCDTYISCAHMFLLNDPVGEKILHFSDGTSQRTGPCEIRYIPKGASYSIERLIPGGSWTILFDIDKEINEKPFSRQVRDYDSLLKSFKEAAKAANGWYRNTDFCDTVVKKCIYDVIVHIRRDYIRSYMPSKMELLVQPAVDEIERSFMKNGELKGAHLAALCGVSEAYFRRVFRARFGITPGEYAKRLRINYAKALLGSGDYSVGETALLCGYAEVCHFSREFTRCVGVSPGKYHISVNPD